ncbi:hypothetical protein VSDG_00741 [Cytospora chrysosperma]|uniref:Uncharacterized protein n=1 Tax=Cytospora chrysosperma TaxID=252740 RepID=A0A423WL02_CYTCH|nr:hypothetical protein VSDG_00741 [Valsa sordida]
MDSSKPFLQNPEQPAASGTQEHDLNTWNGPRMAERLLLDIQYECARNNVDLPWDRIAHRMNPGSSSSAIHHYLWRTRQQLIAEGHLVPPQVGLDGLRAANNGSDARGFVCNPEERVDLTTTGVVGWNDYHYHRLNISDAVDVDAFDVETSKGKKTTKIDFVDDFFPPEADDYTTVALQACPYSVEKNPCAIPANGEDEADIMVNEENPFDDCYEWKDEAKDGGDAAVGAMACTGWDWIEQGDTVSQVDTFAADVATAHARTRQLSVAQQASLQPCGPFFGAAQPRLASMDDPLLEGYSGGLSLNPAHTHNITELSPSYTVHSGAGAAQLAAELGYGQSGEILFSHAVDNFSAFGPVAPCKFLRSEGRPIEVQEGSPTPTTRNPRFGIAKNKSTARPTTPTPKGKQRSGNLRSFMSSFEADEEADLTPRATAISSNWRASSTARTASVEPPRRCGSGSMASAVMQDDLGNRWNDDDDIFHSFPGIGLGGPGKSSPELEDEDES